MVRKYQRIVVIKCPPSKVKRKVVRDPTASGGKMIAVSKKTWVSWDWSGNRGDCRKMAHEFIQTPEII